MILKELTAEIFGAAIEIHKELGPGLLESTYERCLVDELTLRGIKAERQKVQPFYSSKTDCAELLITFLNNPLRPS